MDANLLIDRAAPWMRLALQEAAIALEKGEVPVGAVFVQHGFTDSSKLDTFNLESGIVVSSGYNLTNEMRNVRCRCLLCSMANTFPGPI